MWLSCVISTVLICSQFSIDLYLWKFTKRIGSIVYWILFMKSKRSGVTSYLSPSSCKLKCSACVKILFATLAGGCWTKNFNRVDWKRIKVRQWVNGIYVCVNVVRTVQIGYRRKCCLRSDTKKRMKEENALHSNTYIQHVVLQAETLRLTLCTKIVFITFFPTLLLLLPPQFVKRWHNRN